MYSNKRNRMDPYQQNPAPTPTSESNQTPTPESQPTYAAYSTPSNPAPAPEQVATTSPVPVATPIIERLPVQEVPVTAPPAPEVEPATDPAAPTDVPAASVQPAVSPEGSQADPAAPQPFVPSNTAPLIVHTDNGHALGIVAFVLDFVGFAFVGLILGLVASSQAKKAGVKNGLAKAAVILGIIFTILGILSAAALIAARLYAMNNN